jgi:hypothetical protein
MDALERLRQGLTQNGPLLDPAWLEPTRRKLARNLAHIVAWAGGAGMQYAASEGAIVAALKEFWQQQQFSSGAHARYVTLGCAQEFGQLRLRLIEDELRFPKMLQGLTAYSRERRRFRRCYAGLLHSYLRYDPETATRPAGKANWLLARSFLATHVGSLELPGDAVQPAWVKAIKAHQHLFTDRACFEFARRGLAGDTAPFEEMCQRLGIPEKTWVTRRFVLSQVETATKDPDREFRGRLPILLALFRGYEIYADDVLARILERYCRATSDVHNELRDAAVARWQNPWLASNAMKWERAGEKARNTVIGWLKVKLMRDFFGVLADEGQNDRRRLDFWLQYIDNVDDMYFALGKEARRNRSPDFVQLRNEMKGRLLRLTAAVARNNAFIMKVGKHYIVEFGEKGNACFVFDGNEPLPFSLATEVAADATELRHESRVSRLLHMDSATQRWEEKFENELSGLLGAPGTRAPSRVREPLCARTEAHQPAERFDIAFARWRAEHGIVVEDHRPRGGALWVKLPNRTSAQVEKLLNWGFQFDDARRAWRRA